MSKDEYVRVFKKVGLILRPDMDDNDLETLVREDYEKDANGHTGKGEDEGMM